MLNLNAVYGMDICGFTQNSVEVYCKYTIWRYFVRHHSAEHVVCDPINLKLTLRQSDIELRNPKRRNTLHATLNIYNVINTNYSITSMSGDVF